MKSSLRGLAFAALSFIAIGLSGTAANAYSLPAADSVVGNYTWDLAAPILNGRSPYGKNCGIDIKLNGGSLSIDIKDTDAGADKFADHADLSLSQLFNAIVENDKWQRDNVKGYDGSYLPVVVALGAQTLVFDFYNGVLIGMDLSTRTSTGLFREASTGLTCARH